MVNGLVFNRLEKGDEIHYQLGNDGRHTISIEHAQKNIARAFKQGILIGDFTAVYSKENKLALIQLPPGSTYQYTNEQEFTFAPTQKTLINFEQGKQGTFDITAQGIVAHTAEKTKVTAKNSYTIQGNDYTIAFNGKHLSFTEQGTAEIITPKRKFIIDGAATIASVSKKDGIEKPLTITFFTKDEDTSQFQQTSIQIDEQEGPYAWKNKEHHARYRETPPEDFKESAFGSVPKVGGILLSCKGGELLPSKIDTFNKYIIPETQKAKLDPLLLLAINALESRGDAKAIGKPVRVGNQVTKALGAYQILPTTAKGLLTGEEARICINGYGYEPPKGSIPSILHDKAKSTILATCYAYYLQQQPHIGKNAEKILAAFNAGPQNVQKYQGTPPFQETEEYVKCAREIYQEAKS